MRKTLLSKTFCCYCGRDGCRVPWWKHHAHEAFELFMLQLWPDCKDGPLKDWADYCYHVAEETANEYYGGTPTQCSVKEVRIAVTNALRPLVERYRVSCRT